MNTTSKLMAICPILCSWRSGRHADPAAHGWHLRPLLPLYHPVHVAEDCAVIDLATQGRLMLGVGVGYQVPTSRLLKCRLPNAVPGRQRRWRSWPLLERATLLLRRQVFSLSGHPHYAGPVAAARPPRVDGGVVPGGVATCCAARHGWLADPVQSLPIVKRHASRYRAAAAEAGRAPFIGLMRDAVIANSMAEAEAASAPTMYTHRFYFQYGAYVPDEYLKDVTRPEDLSFTKAAQDRLIVGSADDCLAQLQRWQAEIQPDYLIIRFRQPGGPTHQKTLDAIGCSGSR